MDSPPTTVSTTSLPLAAYWLSKGLRYCETDAANVHSCLFRFDDPHDAARGLAAAFDQDTSIQTFIHARLSLARTLAIAKAHPSRRCRMLPPSSRRDGAVAPEGPR